LTLRKKTVRYIVFLSVRFAFFIFGLLPLSAGRKIGSFLGRLASFFAPTEVNIARENLAKAGFGDRADEIIVDMFRHFGISLFEVVSFRRIAAEIDRHVRIEGLDNLKKAADKGKGVIWITGHIGNFELMALAIHAKGYETNVIAREMHNEWLSKMSVDFRKSLGVKTIIRGSFSSGKELLRVFKKGELLGLLIDQDSRHIPGVFVDFLGEKANTPSGAAELALRFGVPVISGFINREKDGTHVLRIYPEFETVRTGDEAADVVANTQVYTRKIEEHILSIHPEQWSWFHRRWKSRPGENRN